MARMVDADKLIENFKNTEDAESCMWTLAGILSEIEEAAEERDLTEFQEEALLYELLKEHAGHTVEEANANESLSDN